MQCQKEPKLSLSIPHPELKRETTTAGKKKEETEALLYKVFINTTIESQQRKLIAGSQLNEISGFV